MKITQPEYCARRTKLMAQMLPNSIAILASAPISKRGRDLEYPYRPDSNFYYLSGFDEPCAVLALIPGRKNGQYIIFCRERNLKRELWDGKRFGLEGAMSYFGADDAFPITDIDEILPNLIEGKTAVYYAIGNNLEFDNRLLEWINSIKQKVYLGAIPPHEHIALEPIMYEMRLFKSPQEVAIMEHAAQISAKAHIHAMKACRPNMYEYELEAELDYHFRKNGAKFCAYNSIVASGENACTLHYNANCAPIQNGDLVLIDAGCEIDCYASDITRTFPANGKFSSTQLAIYEIVLQANLAAISKIKPGVCFDVLHQTSVEIITNGLLNLGILQGTQDEIIHTESYREFYMHKVSHWLGLDVHDVGNYQLQGTWRNLEKGMILTIEPGIYIAPTNLNVDKKWRGIGVRIEDNVLVTHNGYQVLTDDVPKNPHQIEQLMQQYNCHTKK